jgi:hypothetical protein
MYGICNESKVSTNSTGSYGRFHLEFPNRREAFLLSKSIKNIHLISFDILTPSCTAWVNGVTQIQCFAYCRLTRDLSQDKHVASHVRSNALTLDTWAYGKGWP